MASGSQVARAAPVELRCRQRDVLAAGQVVVAETVGGLGDPREVLDRGRLLPRAVQPGFIVTTGVPIDSFTAIAVPSALHDATGVDGDRLPGDRPALVAGQEQREVGDVLGGGDVAQGDALEHATPDGASTSTPCSSAMRWTQLRHSSVSMLPGTMQLQRMPYSPTSSATALVNARSDAFAVT